MGKTITIKIIEKAAGREVRVGEWVPVKLDKLYLCSHETPTTVQNYGVTKVYDPNKILIVVGGHNLTTAKDMTDRRRVLEWAKQVGIPQKNVLDYGQGGSEHDAAIEHGWVLPGTLIMTATDGQTPICGAMGCVACPMAHATETGVSLITGKSWTHVVASMKFNLTGALPKGVTPRDVFESILGKIGPNGAMNHMIEWTGPTIDKMSIDGRKVLCDLSAYTGAFSGIVNPDQKTIDYLKPRTTDSYDLITSDDDAPFTKTLDFDISTMEPVIVEPPKRFTVTPVKKLEGKKFDRGFIGTCANGRIEDLRIAAKILKGNRVNPSVHLIITPATNEQYKLALKEGLIETFVEAGVVVGVPGCQMCIGWTTPLVEDEIYIGTSPHNFPGRSGSVDAQINLASPATVAASCIEGKFTDPRRYL
jgi:3-isopropylmalate/(R)-2-methylmalate dehydratase large subunit